MFVLFIVLNEPEHLKDVLTAMKKEGVRGATVIDSMGAGKVVDSGAYQIPLIGGLMRSLEGEYVLSKTIFSVIEREEQVDRAMAAVEKACGDDMCREGLGIMFCLPVTKFRGGELERHIQRRENRKLIEKQFQSEYY